MALGGARANRPVRIEGRPYTTIEQDIVKTVVTYILDDMCAAFNPLTGIFSLYRAGFFPGELDWFAVAVAAAMSAAFLAVGLWVFRNSERQVLKEI